MEKIGLAILLMGSLLSGCSSYTSLGAAPLTSETKKSSVIAVTPTPSPTVLSTTQQAGSLERLLYDVYPDTDAEPVLEFQWGPPDIKLSQVVSVVPYGIWKGPKEKHYDPSVSIQLLTLTSHDPVLALAAGTIVDLNTEQNLITVRYGRNYGITYFHVVDFPTDLKAGTKVEAGKILGYTGSRGGTGWWEIEVAIKRYNLFRTVPPLAYFSANSRDKLQTLLYVAQWKFPESARSWMVGDGDAWTKYLPAPQWRAEPSRVGYALDVFPEAEQDFLTFQNMSWILSNPEKAPEPEVLGPAPSCH